jgi:hypothetical protein
MKPERLAAGVLGTLTLALVAFGSCSVVPKTPVILGERDTTFAAGNGPEVRLLARTFLARQQQSPPDFGYYAYLVFSDRTDATASQRRAVALWLLGSLGDASEAKELKVSLREMALLQIFVQDWHAATAILRVPRNEQQGEYQTLLNAYDYDRAALLRNSLLRLGATVPRVALVASQTPLESGPIQGKVSIVDLDASDDTLINNRLARFQDALMVRRTELGAGEHVVLSRLRVFFEAVGKTIDQLSTALPTG